MKNVKKIFLCCLVLFIALLVVEMVILEIRMGRIFRKLMIHN